MPIFPLSRETLWIPVFHSFLFCCSTLESPFSFFLYFGCVYKLIDGGAKKAILEPGPIQIEKQQTKIVSKNQQKLRKLGQNRNRTNKRKKKYLQIKPFFCLKTILFLLLFLTSDIYTPFLYGNLLSCNSQIFLYDIKQCLAIIPTFSFLPKNFSIWAQSLLPQESFFFC